MLGSKSVRVEENNKKQQQVGVSREVKKYSRDELFDIAQSIDECKFIRGEMEELRNADWTKYNLDRLETTRAASSLLEERTRSDLTATSEENSNNFVQRRKQITRMTSSPSIKSGHEQRQLAGDLGPLSSQVRAKYARLIETMTSNARPERQKLARASSQSGRAERPSQLFGPLRRTPSALTSANSSSHQRRNSEEPMSLPYSINCTNYKGNKAELDEAPIRRIGQTTNNDPEKDDNDDDDFDITSLLSITVLSDIKTIRADLHSFGRQSSSLTSRPTMGANRTPARFAAGQSARMPARSRTALDFSYTSSSGAASQRRPRPQAHFDTQQFVPSYMSRRTYGQQMEAYGASESLPYDDWHLSAGGLFVSAEMAPPAASQFVVSPPSSRAHSGKTAGKPLDESVAKIIESFKAQVKARAEANDEPPASAQEVSQPGKSRDDEEKKSCPQGEEMINSVERRKCSSESTTATTTATTTTTTTTTTTLNEIRSAAAGKAAKSLDPAKGEEVETGTRPAESTSCATSGDGAAKDQRPAEEKRPSGARTSQIPRLISLHQLRNQQQNLCDIPSKPKFESAYKRLRGKSLADEVAESSTS